MDRIRIIIEKKEHSGTVSLGRERRVVMIRADRRLE